jgi:hypothetical protein
MNQEYREQMDRQEQQQMRVQSANEAMRAAAEQKERTVHNEDFLNELRKADLDDSELFDWLEEEYPTWFSGAHAVGNRHEEFGLEADLRMRNKRERAVTENRPGRLLRDRPFLLASMQNAETPQLDAYDDPDIPGDRGYWHDRIIRKDKSRKPVTSEEQSRIYGAAEVAADLWSLAADARGLESVSTVKTETTTRKEESEEGAASRVGRWMG